MSRDLLLVEDEPEIRELLIDAIGGLFDKIYQAEDGLQGLKLLETCNPSLIISDFHMPKLNGIEFVKSLKSKHRQVPIIILTGDDNQSVRKQLWSYGIWDYFKKTGDLNELTQCVQNALVVSKGVFDESEKTIQSLNYEEVLVLFPKHIHRNLINHCANIGLSPSTFIEKLTKEALSRFC